MKQISPVRMLVSVGIALVWLGFAIDVGNAGAIVAGGGGALCVIGLTLFGDFE